jgi:hypothetical protein
MLKLFLIVLSLSLVKSCSENEVLINDICSPNNIAIPNSYSIILPDEFILYWDFKNNDQSIDLLYKFSVDIGYVSLGFMDNKINLELLTIEVLDNDMFKLTDMFADFSLKDKFPYIDT